MDFITRVKELNLRGVEIETASVRKYETEYAAHLLGYTGAITKDTWPSYQEKGGYNMNDTVGVSGAEAAFEEYLHGTPGQQALERNENGKIVSAQWLTDEETGESLAPQPGSNVFLTIDLGPPAEGGGHPGRPGPRAERHGGGGGLRGGGCADRGDPGLRLLPHLLPPPTFGRTTTACWTTR